MFKLKLSNILAVYTKVALQLNKFIKQEQKARNKLLKEAVKLQADADVCEANINKASDALIEINKTLGK